MALDATLLGDSSAKGGCYFTQKQERQVMTIVEQMKENVATEPDLTLVSVVVECNVCGNPVRGTRFAFATDDDIAGKLVHFECAAATINQ